MNTALAKAPGTSATGPYPDGAQPETGFLRFGDASRYAESPLKTLQNYPWTDPEDRLTLTSSFRLIYGLENTVNGSSSLMRRKTRKACSVLFFKSGLVTGLAELSTGTSSEDQSPFHGYRPRGKKH